MANLAQSVVYEPLEQTFSKLFKRWSDNYKKSFKFGFTPFQMEKDSMA